MFFPHRTVVDSPAGTRRARELGRRVEEVIHEYQREHPDLSGEEIRSALGHPGYDDEDRATRLRWRLLVGTAAVLAVLGLLVAILLDDGGRGASGTLQTMPPLVVAFILLAGVTRIAFRMLRSRD